MDVVGAQVLSTGPNGPETPATVGLAFERVTIPSAGRHLDGYLVRAGPACVDPPALLIFHGLGATISRLVQAQKLLYDRCVSSLVFDYTGSGDSSRPGSFKAVNADVGAAYDFARQAFGPQVRLFVLGHSMGNGPLLEGLPHFSKPPAGVIVASAFSSLKASTGRRAEYKMFAAMMPDVWNNVSAVKAVQGPILVVHSDTDQVNPVEEGRQIFDAANQPKTIAIVHGLTHNAPFSHPSEDWWAPVLDFMGAKPPAAK
jgi:alpha-beta hydrolase superfamily lysophospholipase